MDRLDDHNEMHSISRQLAKEVVGLSTKFEKDQILWSSGDFVQPTTEILREFAVACSIYEPQYMISTLSDVLKTMTLTIGQYGHLGIEQKSAAFDYIKHCRTILEKIDSEMQALQLGDQFVRLLGKHGQEASSVLEYGASLMAVYQEIIASQKTLEKPPQKRSITVSYGLITTPESSETSQCPRLAPATVATNDIENKETGGRKTDRCFLPPTHALKAQQTGPSGHRSKTMPGIGLESEEALRQAGAAHSVNIPGDAAIGSLSGLTDLFNQNQEETTAVRNRALYNAISRSKPADQTAESLTEKSPDPVFIETEQPSVIVRLEDLASPATASASAPGPSFLGAAFTAESNLAAGLPVIRPGSDYKPKVLEPIIVTQPPIPQPPEPPKTLGVFTKEWVEQEGAKFGHQQVLTGNRPPISENLPSISEDRSPSLPNSLPVEPKKPATTPTTVRSSTRKSLLWALAGALSIAGVAGGINYFPGHSNDQSSTDLPSTAASASAKPTVSSNIADQTIATEKKAETTVEAEKGIFKIDVDHPEYKKYLQSIKLSTGLVSMIKDISGQVKIDYFQSPADLQSAQKSGLNALSGEEPVLEQRIAIMEAFLNQALKQNIKNQWVVKFFRNHQRALQNFKTTGKWDSRGIDIGGNQFFAAFQAPLKYVTSASVKGYAPNINPETNPALSKMKVAAPTFYQAYLEAGRRMQNETDPQKLVPYNDFDMIKQATCDRLTEVKNTYQDTDARSGITYMQRAWCFGTPGANNYLNQALKHTVEIKETKPVPPKPASAPSTSGPIFNNVFIQPDGYNQSPLQLPTTQPKSGVISRTVQRFKSFFGLGQPKADPVKASPISKPLSPQIPQPSENQSPNTRIPLSENDFVYTKKDLPMYSWKQQIKNYLWG